MTTFVHTSDWHLGFFQYNKNLRHDDFFAAANRIVDKIIKIEPDFVLHTGDLFHHKSPTPGSVLQALKLLNKLTKKKIPVFIIRGNHDAYTTRNLQYGGTALQLLNEATGLNYINDDVMNFNDVDIIGVGHYFSGRANETLQRINQEKRPFDDRSNFKILAIHNFIEGQISDTSEVSLSLIQDLAPDYVAAGHFHIPWKREKLNIFVPGSSESTSANDWNREDNLNGNITLYSSFYEVKLENHNGWSKEVIQHRIPVRPKFKLEISSESIDHLEIKSQISEEINQVKKFAFSTIVEEFNYNSDKKPVRTAFEQPLVRIRLDAKNLPQTNQHLISTQELESELGLLNLEISFDDSFESDFPITQGEHVVVEDLLQELIEESEIDDKPHLTQLVHQTIDYFGQKAKSTTLGLDDLNHFLRIQDESWKLGSTPKIMKYTEDEPPKENLNASSSNPNKKASAESSKSSRKRNQQWEDLFE